ncbi:sugar ABC transporter permease [Lachnospiraceae bacterium TF09-5]|nr:sugar ABC transporter permease [Lachnospiraceae bacterium TF09-5]
MVRIGKDLRMNKYIYLMLLPVIVYLIILNYIPMYGVIIAFKDFKPRLGIMGSPWVGMKYFKEFISSIFFGRTLRNTVILSGLNLVFGFSAPIIFAVLLNEVRNIHFKKTIQTITYLPHFITTVIIASLILVFTNSDGFITQIVNGITGHTGSLIGDKNYFRGIYVISEVWQGFGWGSIVYLAAISGINPELYEAARIDGANKFRQIWNVTLPGIMPTIVIMFIMAVGGLMSIGWEKAFLLQSPVTYETSDIISTFVYRKGFEEMNYSYSTAVGLFNSVINLILLAGANKISQKMNDTSLW